MNSPGAGVCLTTMPEPCGLTVSPIFVRTRTASRALNLVTSGMIPGASGRNFFVEQLGRNKRSVGLDLNVDAGLEVLYRLVEQADVFLTNFLPDARQRLRIGADLSAAMYESLRAEAARRGITFVN